MNARRVGGTIGVALIAGLAGFLFGAETGPAHQARAAAMAPQPAGSPASPVLTTDDIVQINQLVSAYGYMADTRDIDPSQVFTPDGVLDMTELNVGRREHMGEPQYGKPKAGPLAHAGRYALQHLMTNVYVYVANGQVKGRSKWVIPLNKGTWTGGDYLDTYVKTPAGWRIKERKLVPRWGDFEPAVRARIPVSPAP